MKPNNQMRFKNVGNFMNKLTVFNKLLKVEIINQNQYEIIYILLWRRSFQKLTIFIVNKNINS